MKGLAQELFAKGMPGADGESKTIDVEQSAEAVMGKRIRKAMESGDDAALCRAVKAAAGAASEKPGGAYEDDDEEMA